MVEWLLCFLCFHLCLCPFSSLSSTLGGRVAVFCWTGCMNTLTHAARLLVLMLLLLLLCENERKTNEPRDDTSFHFRVSQQSYLKVSFFCFQGKCYPDFRACASQCVLVCCQARPAGLSDSAVQALCRESSLLTQRPGLQGHCPPPLHPRHFQGNIRASFLVSASVATESGLSRQTTFCVRWLAVNRRLTTSATRGLAKHWLRLSVVLHLSMLQTHGYRNVTAILL